MILAGQPVGRSASGARRARCGVQVQAALGLFSSRGMAHVRRRQDLSIDLQTVMCEEPSVSRESVAATKAPATQQMRLWRSDGASPRRGVEGPGAAHQHL